MSCVAVVIGSHEPSVAGTMTAPGGVARTVRVGLLVLGYVVASCGGDGSGKRLDAAVQDGATAGGTDSSSADGGGEGEGAPEWIDFTDASRVTAIVEAGAELWIGTLGGLFRYDVSVGKARFYTKANSGLPGNAVVGLAIDLGGGIWVGTKSAGVARFDGTSWIAYRTAVSEDDLAQSTCILSGPNGMLWVGTRGGLLFGHDGKVWTQYDARTDPLAAWPAITALGLDDDGALLAGTSWGLGRLEGTGLQRVAGLPGQMAQPYAIGRDAAGRLWLAGSSAVAVRQEGSWRVISSASSGLPSDGGLSLAPDNSGGMWLGASGWVAHWISGEWTVLKDSTLADGVSAMLVERSGSVWAGTRGRGVRILSDNGWRQVALATSGLPCERVSRMIEDVHRAIWFATPAGLTRWQAGEWMVFSELDPGLPNLGALTVFGRVDSEVVWVATGANRILRYDGTNWQALDWSASNISGSPITTLYEDRSAWLWVGTEAAGVAVYQSGAWRTYDKEQSGLSSNRVSGFAEDSNGRVWIGLLTDASGSPGGIARFDGASLEMFPSVHDNVLSVAIDGHDVLWVGTGNASGPAYPGGGLGRYDGTGWSFLGPDNSELPFNYVTAVRPAPDGTLWVGAYDGVARHDGASWQAWTPASSKLSDDNIFDILVDDRGNAWIATGNDGVNVFNSGGVRLP